MKMTLVVLAAGLGSRFGGDKQISKVGPSGELLMEYSIYDAIKAGFGRVVFILKKEMLETVKRTCGERIEKYAEVHYAIQDYSDLPDFYKLPPERVKPFGTIHATLCAAPYIDGPFATVNADDYYGVEGFKIMYDRLASLKDADEAVIVPYVLKNTLSDNGGVSRGVCDISPNGELISIAETSGIRAEGDKILSDSGELSPDAYVSMNLWGFHGDAINDMKEYFYDFLRSLPEGELKAECYLPLFVNTLMARGCRVSACPSGDKWFGMTYSADRPDVMSRLKVLTDEGVYPENLF